MKGINHVVLMAGRGVDDRGQPMPASVQQAERALRVGAGRQRKQLGGHDLAELGEAVHPLAVRLGHYPDRAPVRHHDHGPVRPLGDRRHVRRDHRDRRAAAIGDAVPPSNRLRGSLSTAPSVWPLRVEFTVARGAHQDVKPARWPL